MAEAQETKEMEPAQIPGVDTPAEIDESNLPMVLVNGELMKVRSLAQLEQEMGRTISELASLTTLVAEKAQVIWIQRMKWVESKFAPEDVAEEDPSKYFEIWEASTVQNPGMRFLLAVGGVIADQLKYAGEMGLVFPFSSYVVEGHGKQFRYFTIASHL